jgi:hypothetical protein
MKIINEPIKVIAIFNKDGKIEPVKFWYEDETVIVEKILKTYEDKSFGNNNIMFVCQHKGSSIYELKYDFKSNIWYMYKK